VNWKGGKRNRKGERLTIALHILACKLQDVMVANDELFVHTHVDDLSRLNTIICLSWPIAKLLRMTYLGEHNREKVIFISELCIHSSTNADMGVNLFSSPISQSWLSHETFPGCFMNPVPSIDWRNQISSDNLLRKPETKSTSEPVIHRENAAKWE